jgi:hypothetical protein
MESRLSALAWAVLFAGLLDGMMLTSLVWPGLATAELRAIGWLTVGGVWLASAVVSVRRLPLVIGAGRQAGADTLFREAQTEYLKGRWFQAQALLEQVLRLDAGDVDARLLLASLYRHVRRIGQAREELRRLDRFERSGKWSIEIQKELEHLDRLESDGDQAAEDAVPALPAATVRDAA